MAINQASSARRRREWARQQKRREKLAQRQARRDEKAENKEDTEAGVMAADDPMNDPSIDWGAAVRETEIELDDDLQVIEEEEEEQEA